MKQIKRPNNKIKQKIERESKKISNKKTSDLVITIGEETKFYSLRLN